MSKSTKRALSAATLADLARSGLTAADAAKLGIEEAPEGENLFYEIAGLLVPAYRIWYYDLAGKRTQFYRDRCTAERPPKNKEGKDWRYLQPKGVAPRIYYPRLGGVDWRKLAADVPIPLHVTEGEKKAAALTKLGIPTVGVGGVWAWRSGGVPLPDFGANELTWEGRTVRILFDGGADRAKFFVQQALSTLGEQFLKLEAKPYDVELVLPGADPNKKIGVDDLIGHYGGGAKAKRAIEQLCLDEATAHQPPFPGKPLSYGDPRESAATFLAAEYTDAAGRLLLRTYEDTFYSWAGTHWQAMGDGTLRTEVSAFLAETYVRDPANNLLKPYLPTIRREDEVINQLQNLTRLPTNVVPPFWLVADAPHRAEDLVTLQNGLLHAPSRRLLPHTPDFFNTRVLDFAYDARAPKPKRWRRFLEEVCSDEEMQRALQEIIGCIVAGDGRYQKIYFFIGRPRSGKGTVLRLLNHLLGKENIATPTLSSFEYTFGMQSLLGKRLAAVTDMRLSKADQKRIVERLLSISGQDQQTVERKHKDAWHGTLPLQFLLVSNELPTLVDESGALGTRYLVLRFSNSFLGKEDHTLDDQLKEELPGIFLWALDGLRRLHKRGRFVQPESAQEDVRLLADLTSPVQAFLRECCDVGPTYEEEVAEMFWAWQRWCKGGGREHPGSKELFGRNLHAAIPGLKRKQPREDGKRLEYYAGVRLNEAQDLHRLRRRASGSDAPRKKY